VERVEKALNLVGLQMDLDKLRALRGQSTTTERMLGVDNLLSLWMGTVFGRMGAKLGHGISGASLRPAGKMATLGEKLAQRISDKLGLTPTHDELAALMARGIFDKQFMAAIMEHADALSEKQLQLVRGAILQIRAEEAEEAEEADQMRVAQ
jgi:hypothetical protein